MNTPLTATSARPRSSAGSINSTITNHGTATFHHSHTSPQAKTQKRAHSSDDSPGSDDAHQHRNSGRERRRQPGVKRACNECRQQKLRCDVLTQPTYMSCDRCRRLSLECKIDSDFKRIGKRSKNAEMEREIVELRKQLASQQSSPASQAPIVKAPSSESASPETSQIPPRMDAYMNNEEAVDSLMRLRADGHIWVNRRIGDVVLNHNQVQDLFHRFWKYYHPFLPLLDPENFADYYYDASPLLFWTVISVSARRFAANPTLLNSLSGGLSKLVWTTLAEVPQSYIVVKALCILCTWPLPISSTSSDPTFMLSGLMMQIAMQIGLHRPSHAQDFSKFRIELREEELRDRVKTWAACNAVAQRVATGYGQPPCTFYDWTLAPSGMYEPGYKLPEDVQNRLLIEKFSNKVTASLYSNRLDPVGLTRDAERSVLTTYLAREYEEIERNLLTIDYSSCVERDADIIAISILYLRTAGLHLRLSAFFDAPTSRDYHTDLQALYLSTKTFLDCALNLETSAGPALSYSTNYVLQMIVAAGFTLLKLLNSFFALYIDLDEGKNLFSRTVHAIRSISVSPNDLPSRLAEVLAQLWKSSGAGSRKANDRIDDGMDNSLQLKVRCRMSMSLVFDSVWRWRQEFQPQGRGNLDSAVRNPTNPDSVVESSANSVADTSVAPSNMLGDSVTTDGFGDAYNEVFDPMNWLMDGLADFPFTSDLPELEVQAYGQGYGLGSGHTFT